jgi:hypothetical protein
MRYLIIIGLIIVLLLWIGIVIVGYSLSSKSNEAVEGSELCTQEEIEEPEITEWNDVVIEGIEGMKVKLEGEYTEVMIYNGSEWLCIMDDKHNIEGKPDEQIRELCESGRICEVIGHCWRDGRPGEGVDEDTGIGIVHSDYHPNINFRTCRICGKCEKQDMSWK